MRKSFVFILLMVLWLNAGAKIETENLWLEDSIEVDSIVVLDSVPQSLPWPQNLQVLLDSLTADRLFRRTQVGLMVYDLTADSAIYCHGEQQQLRPASTMKLLTSITALDQLGGDFRFSTRLFTRGKIVGHTLVGDLMCVGSMDPMFDSDDLAAFVECVRSAGVDSIAGRIVADRGFKDDNLLGEGWCWDDDNPVLTPLLLNRKDNFVERFADALAKAGVAVTGQEQAERRYESSALLCVRHHSMDEVLQRMMKNSDNLYAESMFYQLGGAKGTQKATAKLSAAVVGQLLEQLGQKSDTYRVADGSGLSLYNYVTAELEVRLLRYAFHKQTIYSHLLPALPIAGRDGTLKKRMIGTPAEGVVKAKTGTVTGVSSLAGYLITENGHQLCFAIINQGVMSAATGRAFQDVACQAMCAPSAQLPKILVPKVVRRARATNVRRSSASKPRQTAKRRAKKRVVKRRR